MSRISFEEARRNAYELLGDALDELRSDWTPGAGPNAAQAEAAAEAREHIVKAQQALDRAARAGR